MFALLLLFALPLTAMESTSPSRPLKITNEHHLVTPRNSPNANSALLEKNETMSFNADVLPVFYSHGIDFIHAESKKLLTETWAKLNQNQNQKYRLGCAEITKDLEEQFKITETKIKRLKESETPDKESDLICFEFDKFIIEHTQYVNSEHAKIYNYLSKKN